MGWLWSDRRGLSWTEQTLASMSPPPLPLLAIFGIVFLLLSAPSYINYKNQVQHTVINFKLFLLFLPVLLIILAQFVSKFEHFVYHNTKARYGSSDQSWELPWGVFLLVVVLLVMVFYQSSVQSMWSPIVSRSD